MSGVLCCSAADAPKLGSAQAGRVEVIVPRPAALSKSKQKTQPQEPLGPDIVSGEAPESQGVEATDAKSPASRSSTEAELAGDVVPLSPYARPVEDVDPERALVSTAKVTSIYRRASFDSPKIGYLRAGAIVRRSAEPASRKGCSGGFYEIAPEGYVCVGSTASLDTTHPLARAIARRADRTAALPYPYGIAPFGRAPFYVHVPTKEEQQRAEPDLDYHSKHPQGQGFEPYQLDDVPEFLRDGQPTISAYGYRQSRDRLFDGYSIINSGFAFVSLFEHEGRRFGLTVDMSIVPLDRFHAVEVSRFHGLPLTPEASLPVVFVQTHNALLYSGDPKGTGLTLVRPLEYREAVAITGEAVRVGDRRYLKTRDGNWLVDKRLLRVDATNSQPKWATPGRTWIDVSLAHQTLVAYEGMTPVFVTLVSTGRDGAQDPETTRSTVQGEFLIHTKHVSITMNSDEVGEEFDLRDVPYVQYFTKGYALHAAYWHDAFGTPRSHGCINLSPLDARWLFGWTDPPVPAAWHGAMTIGDGTLVSIHP